MRKILCGALVALLVMPGCATQFGPMMAASNTGNSGNSANSGNSSQGSNNSGNSSAGSANSSKSSNNSGNASQGSANSSQGSGNSSANSNNSSANSNQSSANSNQSSAQSKASSQQSSNNSRTSSDSNQSSKNSSNGTTDDPAAQRGSYIAAGSALLLFTAAGIGVTVYVAGRQRAANTTPDVAAQAKQAQSWLRANHRQLEQDLALGAGPAIDDLAEAAEIRLIHRARFARLLRTHRDELLSPLRQSEISLATALEVMGRVGELTRNDAVLKSDADAYAVRHPEAI